MYELYCHSKMLGIGFNFKEIYKASAIIQL